MNRLRAIIAVVAVVLVSLLASTFALERPTSEGMKLERARETMGPAGSVYLSDIPWEWATTGWVALADDNLPKLDVSFVNGVLSIDGKGYEKGLGTFPLSEVAYALDGSYNLFQAEVGLDGSVAQEKGSVVFKVFLDGVVAFDSGVLRSGMQPKAVALPLDGVNRLKLVVEDAGDGSALDYANWADARLTPANGKAAPSGLSQSLRLAREERKRGRDQDRAALQQRYLMSRADLEKAFQGHLPGNETSALFDQERRGIVLANDRLALTLGYGGSRHGLLDVINLETGRVVAFDTTPSLTTVDLSTIALSRHTVPMEQEGYSFQRVDDPALGSGMEITADFLLAEADAVVSLRLALYDATSYFTYRLELRDEDSRAAVNMFSFFDHQMGGGFQIGDDAWYITDYSMIRRAEVADDSIFRRELVGLGKPLLLYSKSLSRGLLMAVIDRVSDPAVFSLKVDEGHVSGMLGFEHLVPEDERDRRVQTSPRLFVQVTPCESLEMATERFRDAMAILYPHPPIPDWVKYQWGSWYAFYMDYDEEMIKEQIDYIAEKLADLGSWSILLDAGWYVAEGRDGSDWVVDEEKFPSGLRALVDYAHSRDVKVVLYFSAPYLDDRDREGNWLGLRGFIEKHPDWVIRLQADNTGASYVYDLTNPEVMTHIRELISGFFQTYDVDGIKIDGLGQAEGEQLVSEERDTFGDVNRIRMFTMRIYRLIYEEAAKAQKDIYIESGWATPNFANSLAHTFRYADEYPAFEHRYPALGLLEHIDYAGIQKRMLGQRPNMGMVWGGPESQSMVRTWFQAALAMGAQMTLSTDLTHISSRDLSALRAVLAHYNAFQGETRFVGMPLADSFATTSNGISYLGVLNREPDAKRVALKLADYGLDEQQQYLLFDVAANRSSRVREGFTANLEGGSFRLFLLLKDPGVVWTNSSFREESTPDSLKVWLDGPESLPGALEIYVPSPSSVRLDGEELQQAAKLSAGEGYLYSADTGILRLRYRHDRPHTLEVSY